MYVRQAIELRVLLRTYSLTQGQLPQR